MSTENKDRDNPEVKHRLAVVRALHESIRSKKPIEVMLDETADQSTVKILTSKDREPLDLARVFYTKGEEEPQIAASTANEQPTLLVYERRLADDLNRFAQVGKYLPGFLDEIVPGAAKRPVWIFRSQEEYRLRLPFVRIRFVGRQLVANFSSTFQPKF